MASKWPNDVNVTKLRNKSYDDSKNYKENLNSYKPQKTTASGRVIRQPLRLVQDRVEGVPKYTEKQRAKKLRETLAKSETLTEDLLKSMDKDSGEEDIEEEDDPSEEGNNTNKEDDLRLWEKGRKRKANDKEMETDEKGKMVTRKINNREYSRAKAQKKRKLNNNRTRDFDRNGREFEGQPIPVEQPMLVTNCVMKPYQLDGLRWIVNLRKLGANGILGDEMGLGKTLQTISLFCHLYEVDKVAGPFLVIAPLSTISNWENEVRRFAPSVPCHLLYPNNKALQMWGQLEDRVACPELGGRELGSIFITSYDTFFALRNILQEITWSYVVVDEGHRIKNRKCRLTTELRKLDSTNRLLLTGTPLQNNMIELWALLNFLQPDIFDDCEIFENWFNAKSLHENADEKARLVAQEEKSNILSSIHRIIGPFLLRRVKAEVELSIPPKKEVVVYCPFTQIQANQYRSIKARLLGAKKRAAKDGKGLGHYQMQYMMDLRSAVNHAYILEDTGMRDRQMVDCSGKLQVLEQMLERLRKDGHKTLVFSQMTRLLDLIGEYLDTRNIPYCSLDGRMSYLDRQLNVERFNKSPEVNVFLLSTRAGGLGINLTAADTCIIYDSDWNPQQDLQAQDRCHRIGQTKPVMVYRLVTKDTIDQVMVERAQAKRALERLVVHRDKFKSGAKNLKSTARGLHCGEIMDLLLSEEGLATCTAGSKQQGLEQARLDRLMDRTLLNG